ncbi:MAG: MATE family efflux transporter [Candidatus Altiarchaeota archaeon]|nr:MATE family efflux transporter [Candidatus Altiarchaeota archaeon]
MTERVDRLMMDPRRGLLMLAWPIMVSMFFSMLLNFVDFFFVGGLGPKALAGVQVSFPVFFFIIAVGSGVGIGTTALIAKRLGEKNKKWAEETALHSFLLGGMTALLFTTMVLFVGPISNNLGGGPEVSLLAGEYMWVIFAGSIVFFLVFSMNSVLQGEGDTKTPMKISLVFTICNIVLDPIFIYTLKMGVGGAALATVLSEVVALSLYFWYLFVGKRSHLEIKPKDFIYTPQIMKNILRVGIPSAVAQMGLSVAVLGINFILSGFGDAAISAYGVGFRIDSLAIMPILGLGAGVIPMVGYFRGTRDYAGARKVYRLGLKLALAFTATIGVVVLSLATLLPGIFTTDSGVISMASGYLAIIAFAYPLIGMTIILSSAFQGMGRGMPSLIITMARAIIIAIPMAYYLAYPAGLGVVGVWLGILLSTLFSATFSLLWIENYFRKICSRCYGSQAS